MAQLAERSAVNRQVLGSIPSGGVFYGRVAQLVEHWSNKPRVASSSLVVTIS